MARYTGGEFDLLKLVSSYDPDKDPRLSEDQRRKLKDVYTFRHDNRLETLGVTNEPCFEQAAGPDARRYGLWLDLRDVSCAPDPFQDDQKYPGVAVGVRGRGMALGSAYGVPSGVMGLRLFPNPAFNEAAARNWDAERFYTDPVYYGSKDLVTPYRVGMTCAFCHAGLNPARPAKDANHPEWENLSSTAGAQFLRMDRVAMWRGGDGDFLVQALRSARPGTVDLSLLATDHVLNPRVIQPIHQMGARMRVARQWGKETLGGASMDNRQMSTYVAGGPLAAFFEEPATVWTPRFGTSAMDSVGILGAINRFYPAMGMFSEEWLLHFSPLLGGTADLPVDLKVGRENSAYWQATEEMTPNVVRFLISLPAPQAPAPESGNRMDKNAVARGTSVFAERCASCHSSKFPPPPAADDPASCSGSYLECWNRYWTWTGSSTYQQQMQKIAAADDFLKDNALTNDLRTPLPAVGTNACTAISAAGANGGMWEQFTSQTYRALPSAGSITYYQPYTGAPKQLALPRGGPGYLRAPSLVGLWNTAPYLGNNSVGRLETKLDAASRIAAFQEAMEEMLWPERREKDALLGDKIPGKIDRTSAVSTLRLPARAIPDALIGVLEPPIKFLPHFSLPASVEIGPIPAGTPIGLLTNLNLLDPHAVDLLVRLKKSLKSGADFSKFADALLEVSACPDLVVNRGHYFGTGIDGLPALTDAQKSDLIEFLKTM
jgi:hypothetical protein